MTARQVQARLGRPVAKGGWKWYYARVTVTFRNRRVVELMTTRSTERFANGLGVDSSEAEVRSDVLGAALALSVVLTLADFGKLVERKHDRTEIIISAPFGRTSVHPMHMDLSDDTKLNERLVQAAQVALVLILATGAWVLYAPESIS